MQAFKPFSARALTAYTCRISALSSSSYPAGAGLLDADADAGRQALIKAYNGALKEPVLLAVSAEYQTLWGCERLWVVPAQRDKEGRHGRDSPAYTQQELFTVIDAMLADRDGAHALIQAYQMAGGRIEEAVN